MNSTKSEIIFLAGRRKYKILINAGIDDFPELRSLFERFKLSTIEKVLVKLSTGLCTRSASKDVGIDVDVAALICKVEKNGRSRSPGVREQKNRQCVHDANSDY